jgi:uncharacterized protein
MGGTIRAEAAIHWSITETKQDWRRIASELDEHAWAMLPGLMDGEDCPRVAALYEREDTFRSRVVMARHGFGRGEYRYFSYPLTFTIENSASGCTRISRPSPMAGRNGWASGRGFRATMPITSGTATQTARCGPRRCCCAMGLAIITACINMNGAAVFSWQAAVLLSEPGGDFTGGEFVVTERRPRMQSRAMVVPLTKGDSMVFAVNGRPVKSSRGD